MASQTVHPKNMLAASFAAACLFIMHGSYMMVAVECARLSSEDLALAAFRLQTTDAAKVKDYRFYVGSDCQVATDCFGGGCMPDPQRPGLKACVCLPGQFNFQILPGFGLCLKCRDLTPKNNWCFFDQECSCADANAFCQGAAPPQTRGRCACKANYYALPTSTGSIRCGTGTINSECQSNDQCTNIRTLDSVGNRIPPHAWSERFAVQCMPPSLSPRAVGMAGSSSSAVSTSSAAAAAAAASATSGGVLVARGAGGGHLTVSNHASSSGASSLSPSLAGDTVDLSSNASVRLNDFANDSSPSSGNSCQCSPGFMSSSDGLECRDIDECQMQFRVGRTLSDAQFSSSSAANSQLATVGGGGATAPACTVNGRASSAVRCNNLIGGYECECASRFGLQLAQGGLCCEDGFVPCLDGSQCVPFSALCNGVPDCPNDCSDERYVWCMFNSYNPPPNFGAYPQCRRTDGAGGPTMVDGTIGLTPPAVAGSVGVPNNMLRRDAAKTAASAAEDALSNVGQQATTNTTTVPPPFAPSVVVAASQPASEANNITVSAPGVPTVVGASSNNTDEAF